MVVNEILTDKTTKRKEQILLTAMKLFTLKGYQLTSMQEIAELCKMSKGSLYLHFKSKEELLFSIFLYFSQMLEEKIQMIEQDHEKTEREQFALQVEVLLSHFLEYREFFFVQMREKSHQTSDQFTSYLLTKQMELLEWLGKKVIQIYGQEFADYAIELAVMIEGILTSYMRFFVFQQVPSSSQKLGLFVLHKLDHLTSGIRKDQHEPLIRTDEWRRLSQSAPLEPFEKKHPVFILKEMKIILPQLGLPPKEEEMIRQSIQLLEKELMELDPRSALIQGMCHNIRHVEGLEDLYEDLATGLSYMFDQ